MTASDVAGYDGPCDGTGGCSPASNDAGSVLIPGWRMCDVYSDGTGFYAGD